MSGRNKRQKRWSCRFALMCLYNECHGDCPNSVDRVIRATISAIWTNEEAEISSFPFRHRQNKNKKATTNYRPAPASSHSWVETRLIEPVHQLNRTMKKWNLSGYETKSNIDKTRTNYQTTIQTTTQQSSADRARKRRQNDDDDEPAIGMMVLSVEDHTTTSTNKEHNKHISNKHISNRKSKTHVTERGTSKRSNDGEWANTNRSTVSRSVRPLKTTKRPNKHLINRKRNRSFERECKNQRFRARAKRRWRCRRSTARNRPRRLPSASRTRRDCRVPPCTSTAHQSRSLWLVYE